MSGKEDFEGFSYFVFFVLAGGDIRNSSGSPEAHLRKNGSERGHEACIRRRKGDKERKEIV